MSQPPLGGDPNPFRNPAEKPPLSLPNPYSPGSPSYSSGPSPYMPGTGPTMSGPGFGPPPPAKTSSGCLPAAIVASVVGVLLLACGGCCGLGLFVFGESRKEQARQLSVEFRNDPKVKEEVGEVEDITYNWGASLNREDGQDVYDIKGDKGTAQLVVMEDENEDFISVELRNGRGEWQLPSEASSPPPAY